MPVLKRSMVLNYLKNHELAKALSYEKNVILLKVEEFIIEAHVKGSKKIPYTVNMHIVMKNDTFDIVPYCSCPHYISICKHVGATLLAASVLEGDVTEKPAVPSYQTSIYDNKNNRQIFLKEWQENFKTCLSHTSASKKPTKAFKQLIYTVEFNKYSTISVYIFQANFNKEGQLQSETIVPWDKIRTALKKPPQYLSAVDLQILHKLNLQWQSYDQYNYSAFSLNAYLGGDLLTILAKSGRLFYGYKKGYPKIENYQLESPVVLGETRSSKIAWVEKNKVNYPELLTTPVAKHIAFLEDPWYFDNTKYEIGKIDLPVDFQKLKLLLSIDTKLLEYPEEVAIAMAEVMPEFPTPPFQPSLSLQQDISPKPVLTLHLEKDHNFNTIRCATLDFEYNDVMAPQVASDFISIVDENGAYHIARKINEEEGFKQILLDKGMIPTQLRQRNPDHTVNQSIYTLEQNTAEQWGGFIDREHADLIQKGWKLNIHEDFLDFVYEVDDIYGDITSNNDWFDLEMGITVNNKPMSLIPLLLELFERDHRWLGGKLAKIPEDEPILLKSTSTTKIKILAHRIKSIVRVLLDLFSDMPKSGKLKISSLEITRLSEIENTARWQFHGDESIREMAKGLKNVDGIPIIPCPQGLNVSLRPYQQIGVNWLQFLRSHKLSGILADDMGLGKTMQTLALLLIEKEEKRLLHPALIVMPTSLIPNWEREAQQYAPALRLLVLHGNSRQEHFDRLSEFDLILTTYPLLWRDVKHIAQYSYHYLILDEAHFIKNEATRASAAIRTIQANHRLCLTGTPLENHLGELWSLFDFILPGFLGTKPAFSKKWRTPIEKNNNQELNTLLSNRIRPFILRRKKADVAADLPLKTIITHTIEIDGEQRDLYETIRISMQEKIKTLIETQGLAKSHIQMLEALLKLRQICCDPRLLKSPKYSKIIPSAKLNFLKNMLVELIEDGRRVLLFSQFAEMLDLLEHELNDLHIPFVRLCGKTKDRKTPVENFQAGKVPLFLISLKAGGVGLNLTAADTVIHYDPWWNPATENQATDRAHRLGQDKPVFVYKLIIKGSIEEKILDLQMKKATLAESILQEREGQDASAKFTAEDVAALFAPIPTI